MADTITQTVTDYVHAVTYADPGLLREVFDPRATSVGHYEGATEWLSLEDLIDQIRSAASGFSQDDSAFEILGIDKTGDAASVKLILRSRGIGFSEYLSLLQRDRNWTITHRLYHLQD